MLVDFNWKGILFVDGEDVDVDLDVTARVHVDKGYVRDKNGDGLPPSTEVMFLKAIDNISGNNYVDWIEDNEELEALAIEECGEY